VKHASMFAAATGRSLVFHISIVVWGQSPSLQWLQTKTSSVTFVKLQKHL